MIRLQNNGFTLIELLITMSIMVIMLAIAVPSYQTITTGVRMNTEINTLVADLNFARSEAIKLGQPVTICPATSTAVVCNSASTLIWSAGWNVLNITGGTQLRITNGVTHGDTMQGGVYSATIPPIQFNAFGYTSFTGTVTLHDSNNDATQRRCIVFVTGSWSTTTGATCP